MARAITLHGPIVGARFKKPAKKKPVGKQEETEAERQRRLANQSAATQIATTGIRAGRGVPREILDTATGASGKGSTAVQRERDRSTILSSRRKERSAATAERLQRQRQAQQEGVGRRKSQQADIAEQASRGVLPRAVVRKVGEEAQQFELGKDVSGFQRGDVITPEAAERYKSVFPGAGQEPSRIRGMEPTLAAIDAAKERLSQARVAEAQRMGQAVGGAVDVGGMRQPAGEGQQAATATFDERARRLAGAERDVRAAGTGTELDRFGPTDEGQAQRLGEFQLETSETILAQLPPERQTVMREIAATARSIRTGLAQSGIVGKDADSIIRKHLQGDFQNETGYSNSDVKFYLDNEASIQQGATPLDVDVGRARATIQPTDPGLPGIGQRRNALGQADASNTMAPIPTEEQIGSFRRDEDMLFQEDPEERKARLRIQSGEAGKLEAEGKAIEAQVPELSREQEVQVNNQIAAISIPDLAPSRFDILGLEALLGGSGQAILRKAFTQIDGVLNTPGITEGQRKKIAARLMSQLWWTRLERNIQDLEHGATGLRGDIREELLGMAKAVRDKVVQAAG